MHQKMNETISVQHRGEKRPRNHTLYNTSNGSVFYFKKNKNTNRMEKRYVTEWWKENRFSNKNRNNNNTNNDGLTQRDLNLLRTYYALDYEPGLRNDIIKGYKKDKSMYPSMDAFERSLVGAVGNNTAPTPTPPKKRRVRPAWMKPSKNNNYNNFLYYDKDGQYINRDLEESQLF